MSPEPTAFWIDREHASDGTSRYGAYLRFAAFEPWTDDHQAVELAVFAWRQATRPVMVPGYVRYHPRVITTLLERSDWDGSLLARVDLVAAQPSSLRTLPAAGGRGLWRDWPQETAFCGPDTYYDPGTDDLARGCYSLTSVSLRFAVPSGDLPQPSGAGPNVAACREAVEVVVGELNRTVGPVLSADLGCAFPAAGWGR